MDGSLMKLLEAIFVKEGPMFFYRIWPNPLNPDAWKIIAGYSVFELALMRLVPGKEFRATVTPSGHVPVYKANGVQCYLITTAALTLGGIFKIIRPAVVYDMMGELLSAMNVFALVLVLILAFKGIYFPSTADSGSNKDIIVDYFWGTELYPRILGFDVKQFTNCRFGMMFWQVGIICYAFKQFEDRGYIASSLFASLCIQTVYVAKFFWWETGYFCTMDIQHDRAGYYLCWGCLNWVPSIYTFHTYWMVKHPVHLSVPVFAAIVIAGVFSIWVNYDCDRQRQEFRASNGKMKVWGHDPEYIVATYKTADGEERNSLLLTDGWWRLARHFHYIPELSASFFWCCPAMFTHVLPFFYFFYLSILLLDRAWRDDARCAEKYTRDWDRYCSIVQYKIIPGVV